MNIGDTIRAASVEEIIRTCDKRGIRGKQIAALLQAHGFETAPGRQFTRQRISQIRLRMADFGNRVIVDSERIEDQVRSSATLLRVAAQSDERAERYYRAYEDELLRVGCPLKAFSEVKRLAQEERAERAAAKEVEAEAEAEVVQVVEIVEVHADGMASI